MVETYKIVFHTDNSGGLLNTGNVGHYYAELQTYQDGVKISSIYRGKHPQNEDLSALGGDGVLWVR